MSSIVINMYAAPTFTRSNLVHQMGYSLERVHTGILAWIIENRDGSSAPQDLAGLRSDVLSLLLGKQQVAKIDSADLAVAQVFREERFGRRRTDLSAWIGRDEGESPWTAHLLLVEAKVDGAIDYSQLAAQWEGARKAKDSAGATLHGAVLLLGASRFSRLPASSVAKAFEKMTKEASGEESPWRVVVPEDLLSVLGCHEDVVCEYPLLRDWMLALTGEVALRETLALAQFANDSMEEDVRKPGNGRWLYVYDAFRKEWDHQNHVAPPESSLCCSNSWIAKIEGREPILQLHETLGQWTDCPSNWDLDGSKLFWEFNRGSLILKIHLDQSESALSIPELRGKLWETSEDDRQGIEDEILGGSIVGNKCKRGLSQSPWVSLVRWDNVLTLEGSPNDLVETPASVETLIKGVMGLLKATKGGVCVA